MSTTSNFIAAIADGDHTKANEVFAKAIKEKVNTILDIKRVSITSEIYAKVEASKNAD